MNYPILILIIILLMMLSYYLRRIYGAKLLYVALDGYKTSTSIDLTGNVNIIIILDNFSTGGEKSFKEITSWINIEPTYLHHTTHDTRFFNSDYLSDYDDIVVLKRDGGFISLVELISNKYDYYTDKEIRAEHNLEKMLRAESFSFRY